MYKLWLFGKHTGNYLDMLKYITHPTAILKKACINYTCSHATAKEPH